MLPLRSLPRQTVLAFDHVAQQRNMATLREIQLRLKSVQNISKITKSMKMIAATKLTRAQRSMDAARAYGEASNDIFMQAETATAIPETHRTLLLTISSDRGLCGGIHSSVSKATKRRQREANNTEIVVLGDKAKSQISREFKDDIRLSFNQLGKNSPTFAEACAVADTVSAMKVKFDKAELVYNRFKSVISFEADTVMVFSEDVIMNSPKFALYEVEDDVLENLYEFNFANALFWTMSEGHTAEMAARRTAMENATKNAGEMIDKLTLTYNRGRQAVITTALIDIITGASAL